MTRAMPLAALLLVALCAAPGLAQVAGDVQATVISIDPYNSVLVLEDGRRIRVAPGSTVLVDGRPTVVSRVAPGSRVTIRRSQILESSTAPPRTMGALGPADPAVSPQPRTASPQGPPDAAVRSGADAGQSASARTQARIVTRGDGAVPFRPQKSEARVVPGGRVVVVGPPDAPAAAPSTQPATSPAAPAPPVRTVPAPASGALITQRAPANPWCEGAYAPDLGTNFGACSTR